MAGLGKTPEARPSTCAAVLEKDGKGTVKTDFGASAGRPRAAAVFLGVLAVGALVGAGWWWQTRVKAEKQRKEALSAERAEAARVAAEKENHAAEKKLLAEKARADAAKAEADRIDKENRQAELIAFRLSAKAENAHELIGRESEEVRSFFEAEIGAFESDRKAGESAKALSRNVAATNFFTAALSKATALKVAVELRASYLSSRVKAEAARKSADAVGAKDALPIRYANAQRLMSAADAFARGRNFTEAIAKAVAVDQEYTALRAEVIQATLNLAESHRDAERWQDCLAAAEKVRGYESQNAEAAALKKEAERHLGPKAGGTRTITLPGGATMEMVWCPSGSFMMGSPETEADRGSDEARHRVALMQGFWMGKYEVTQTQWESVMGENPSSFKGADRPVEWVSWNDCQAFIRRVNSGGQVTVALPTEAQWEYACRAGTTTPYSFGSSLNGDKANCDGNYPYGTTIKGRQRKETAPVGSYAPNAWGLYDMHGNVLEWCMDRYGKYDGDATNPTGSVSGIYRVARGGCWDGPALLCRSSDRSRYVPTLRDFYLGFRLVCSSEERM